MERRRNWTLTLVTHLSGTRRRTAQQTLAAINREWTLMLAPGICIILITLAFNILGDGLRDSIGRETRTGGGEATVESPEATTTLDLGVAEG